MRRRNILCCLNGGAVGVMRCVLILAILNRIGKSLSKYAGLMGVLKPIAELKSISFSEMQHENSHLFSPQPSA